MPPSDYEQELQRAKTEIEEAMNEFHAAICDFALAFMEASNYVPTFEGEDAAVLLALGIAP